jgi:tetratricopeptide (TPR) repeat protein
MSWPPVSRNEDKGLAHYVVDEIALGFPIAIARQDTLAEPNGRRQIIEAIYNALSERPIHYALEPYNADARVQQIRAPELVLDGAREGTCLDLALLFAGIALNKDLAPLLVMLDGHAFVAVSLDDDRRTASEIPRRNREGGWLEEGVLRDEGVLRQLIDEGHYLAVECTGFAKTAVLSTDVPENTNRVGGMLAFDSAISAGRKQLDFNQRPFRFAIDLAVLRDHHGFAAYPTGLSSLDEEKLMAVMEAQGILQTAEAAGLQRQVIISLARGLKRDVADFDQAIAELQHAVDLALDVIEKGERGTDEDGFVNAVLARVAERLRNDDLDGAVVAIDEAHSDLESGHRRSQVTLLEEAVKIDTLRRDAIAAARRIETLVTTNNPTNRPAWLPEFRARYDEYMADGEEKGINFSFSVGVELARRMVATARDTDERGFALGLLGQALSRLGESEGGTARLEEAVAALRADLDRLVRKRVPLEWAGAQVNLGNALCDLGKREGGTARLDEAVAAYRAALQELGQKQMPLDWANAQNNLGNALSEIGEREGATARLEEAVTAFHAALEERTRERAPRYWATTQNNLGIVLCELGRRENGTTRLEEAVVAFRAALEEFPRERMPLRWAMAQSNLGGALRELGSREKGTARLEEAVVACRAALQERLRERSPLDWAASQVNLGNALCDLGRREDGTAQLEEGVATYRAALGELSREHVPLEWAMVQSHLGTALSDLGRKEGGTARLEEALAAYRAALQEQTHGRVPVDRVITQNGLGDALRAMGDRQNRSELLEEAVVTYRTALRELRRERLPLEWATIQRNLGSVLMDLGLRESGTARLEEAVAAYRAALQVWTLERQPLEYANAKTAIVVLELAIKGRSLSQDSGEGRPRSWKRWWPWTRAG